MLHLFLRPYIERAGYHVERFDAYLDDELICTHRSGWHAPARELLRRGYSPETLLQVQHAGYAFDPTIVPKSIGEIAKWDIRDEDRTGLRRRRWQPDPGDPLAAMYPTLWAEPSQWPWDAPPDTAGASPALPGRAAA
jgi:hypothetical protein